MYICLFCVALVLATLIAFEPVRNNGFVNYDDDGYVTNNSHVKGGITGKSVIWAFTAYHESNWHPLTWLSHMLDCQLFGLNPLWHHMTNLLFHIVNTLLLFLILKKMTGAIWCSGFVAAAFALHPLHVESVAWVAERKDVLSGFFWMLTIAAYIRYVKRPAVGRYVLVFLVFGLGLMAKPMVITLPFVLLLLDYWPLNRMQQKSEDNTGLSIKHLIVEKIPLFVLVAASGVITFMAQQHGGVVKRLDNLPASLRVSNALASYVGYIVKMIYPTDLSALYPLPGYRLKIWYVIVCFIMLATITAVVIFKARKHYWKVGWLWYLGTLVPVIGLVQVGVQGMADRYTYLPSIGIFIIIAWGAADIVPKWRQRGRVLAILSTVVLVILILLTRAQVRHWQNNLTLFKHAIEATDRNYIMHNNYGSALVENGQLSDAVIHFREAVRINPKYLVARDNIGQVYLDQGRTTEAVRIFTELLRMKPNQPKVLDTLASILATSKDKNVRNPAREVRLAERACELTNFNQPEFLCTLTAAYAAAGSFDKAIQTAEKAIKLAEAKGETDMIDEIQEQLKLYKSGQPFGEK